MKAEVKVNVINNDEIEILGKKYFSMDYVNRATNETYKRAINVHVAKVENIECPKCGYKSD